MTLLVLFLAISASFTLQGCRLPAVPAEQAEPSRQAVYRKLTAQEAKAQLDRDPAITLVHLSHQLGFAEQSVLSRAAHRWFGMSPMQYRRQQGQSARS